tara:strand:- start:342 stop:701 length:360 start_codon:yes stop_codon:yes gene_type:complete
MKKNSISYSDLSKKELEYLKEVFITEKVINMSNKELKDYVTDSISCQIKNTIGSEEESEAWIEMKNFFGEKFEIIIGEIQKKFLENNQSSINEINKIDKIYKKSELNEKEVNKVDMWED